MTIYGTHSLGAYHLKFKPGGNSTTASSSFSKEESQLAFCVKL